MTDDDLRTERFLEAMRKIDHISTLIENMMTQQTEMERKISKIAVQEEKITTHSIQIKALWRKWDEAFGPEGTISKMKAVQAACPKKDVERALASQDKVLSRQWVAIGLLATIFGLMLKALG